MAAFTTGMVVGPEGPLAHIGAAIANNITTFSAWGSLQNLSHPPPYIKDKIPSPSSVPRSVCWIPWLPEAPSKTNSQEYKKVQEFRKSQESQEQLDLYEELISKSETSSRPNSITDMAFLDSFVRQVQGSPGRKAFANIKIEELPPKSSLTYPTSLVSGEGEDPFIVEKAKHMGLSEEAITTLHAVEEELVGKEEVENDKTLRQK